MANWKLSGIVPDSDEEDELDSQRTVPDGNQNHGIQNEGIQLATAEEQAKDVKVRDDEQQTHVQPKSPEKPILTEDKSTALSASSPVRRIDVEILCAPLDTSSTLPAPSPDELHSFAAVSELSEVYQDTLPKAALPTEGKPTTLEAPYTARRAAVEIPFVSPHTNIQFLPSSSPDELLPLQAVLELGEISQDEDLSNLPVLKGVSPSEEEISHSFAQITSLSSSQLSSPPESQPALSPLRRGSKLPEHLTQSMILDAFPDVEIALALSRNRTFRARKPIQLNPYLIENDKYRRTLKAGGLAPLRLASSQDDGRRKSRRSRSLNLPQEDDSQLSFVAAGTGDVMDIDSDGPSSSPPASGMPEIASMFERSDREDDDDLPNLEALLKTRKERPSTARKKSVKSYSIKQKHYGLPNNKTQSRTVRDIFNVPASPPITSSPHPAGPRQTRSSISRLSSVSSTMQATTLSHHDTPVSLRDKPDITTPVASVSKARLTALLAGLSSESEEGETVPPDTRDKTSTPSSSDEDTAILKNSKRIRGVLPASHLRLAQQKKPLSIVPSRRKSLSLSPVKGVARRGIALPRYREEGPEESSPTNHFSYISDETDDDNGGGAVDTNEEWMGLQTDLQESRMGFAEEEDHVDTMYSSRKRPPSGSKKGPYKKCRIGNSTASEMRQPRITESLRKQDKSKRGRTSAQTKISRKIPRKDHPSASSKPSYLELGVLDLSETHNQTDLPRFIQTAGRTVRRRNNQGRQSPSHKFIRLATREDTHDAQTVLNDWKSGKIQVHHQPAVARPRSGQSKHAAQQISHNVQSRLPETVTSVSEHQDVSVSDMPRKVHIRRGDQQSMSAFVSRREGNPRVSDLDSRNFHATRPAQLETPETPKFLQNSGYQATNFQWSKKFLDTMYKKKRGQPDLQANIQINRFFGDEYAVKQSIEVDPIVINIDADSSHLSKPARVTYVKKRAPQRLDVGAAKYRQPSSPLVVDYLITEEAPVAGSSNFKLTGLAKFGTRYTIDFNILPLRSGIFFHESTLIGQGLLKETLKDSISNISGHGRPRTFLRLGEKTFTWGEWNDDVSSELSLCFDCIIEQLLSPSAEILSLDSDVVKVLLSVLDYVRNHLSIAEPLKRKDFLNRLIEVLGDFNSRLLSSQGSFSQHVPIFIDVSTVQTLLVTRLLRVARTNTELSIASNVEEHMKDLAVFFVKTLLAQGFDSIRKLYDKLQYLSFREEGIKRDQYIAQAWIVLIKILAEAKMPRVSFWDVVSTQLLLDIQDVVDARVLEKTWYCMFSILPLCEFDDHGFTSPGIRHTNSFEGWRIPQQLIKKVTSLYQRNQKQAPGFNDYCRSLFARCHYLVVRWGWWRSATIIGSLFDFFASQQLANLRNEVANDSPNFLRELDTNPSLDIEPEDRCFHIFLKIIALVIKHLADSKDTKAIRNLVARLLPNHDRQFSKNEEIRQTDIASLRNYHDLLCTMYWAAPVNERPPVTLLQDLVLSGQSHNEACLVNLRSWRNLARFIVATSFDVPSFVSLKKWQTKFFSGLCQQYLGQEDEVRQQAESLQQTEGEPMTESRIEAIVTGNMKSTMVPMCVSIEAMGDVIKVAKSHLMLMQALNSDVLDMAFNPAVHVRPVIAESLLNSCLHVLEIYIDKVNELCPKAIAGSDTVTTSEDDSQDSYDSLDMADFAAGLERSELASQLQHMILNPLSSMLRKALESSSSETKHPMLLYRFVGCWARVVSLVTEKGVIRLDSFVMKGDYAVFENRESFKVANEYWPLFLARLLQSDKTLDDFKITGFDIGLEWLLSLLKPQSLGEAEEKLSTELSLKGHFLCSHFELHTTNPTHMLRSAIRKISSLMINKTTNTELGIGQQEAERLFSNMFKEIMKTMQRLLESLEPLSETHKDFVEALHPIVADIKCYASGIAPLIDFFVYPSNYYWPPDTDPTMLEAGIISYCLRLGQPGKTLSGLFYFLHSAWQKALVSGTMSNYIHCIKKALKRWDFADFMLAEFLPAVISVGFSANGWLLCLTFLAPLSNRIVHLLESFNSRSERAFEHLVNLLRLIMNGIIYQHRKRGGVQPTDRSIIAVAMKFWFAISIPMRQYVERHPEQTETLAEVADPLTHFIWHALQSFHSNEPEFWNPTGQIDVRKSKHFDDFVAVFEGDIKDNWEFGDAVGEKVMVKAARSKEKSPVQWFEWSLREILEGEIGMYRVLFPSRYEVSLSGKKSYFIDKLYF